MPLTLVRLGSATGSAATEFEIAGTHRPNGPQILCVRRANGMTHSYWDFLPDGSLAELPLQSNKPGGIELALATYNEQRALNIHRTSANPKKLIIEAYRTNGSLILVDQEPWTDDRQAEIVMFGATPPTGAVPAPPAPQPAPPPPGGGSSSGTPGQPQPGPGGPVTIATDISISIGPKVARAVIASLTAANQLRLTLWAFDAGGQVRTQLGKSAEFNAGPVQSFSIAKGKELWSPDGKFTTGLEFATAVRDTNNKLKVQRWRLTLGSQGTPTAFTLLSEVIAPESITRVSCCPVEALGGTQLATAVQSQSGNALKVIAWKLEPAGGLTRLTDAVAGAIDAVHAAPVRGRYFVTSTRKADGVFKAHYWAFPATAAGALTAEGSAEEGLVDPVLRCVHVKGTGSHVGDTVFATRRPKDGKLQLWRYSVTE